MKYIICYDISETKIRTQVAKYLESIAYRMQMSVFTLEADETAIETVKAEMLSLTKDASSPRITIVPVCSACAKKLWRVGEMLEDNSGCIVL